MEHLTNFLQAKLTNSNGTYETNLKDLIYPWFLYSMFELAFDVEMPVYQVYRQQCPQAAILLEQYDQFLTSYKRIQCSLFSWCPRLTPIMNWYLFDKQKLHQMRQMVNDAIQYRENHHLFGLDALESSKQKKNVKFRDEVYSSLLENDSVFERKLLLTDCCMPRQIRTRQQTKRISVSLIDIMLDFEIEPDDKTNGMTFKKMYLKNI